MYSDRTKPKTLLLNITHKTLHLLFFFTDWGSNLQLGWTASLPALFHSWVVNPLYYNANAIPHSIITSKTSTPSDILRYFQIFSDNQIIRSSAQWKSRLSDHQSFRPSDILRYSQIISDYQTVSTSDLQIFSDYFRPSSYQIVRTADPQIFSDYFILSDN